MTGHLDLWTVYDHPKDYPDVYVVRRSEVHTGGSTIMTADIITSASLKEIRREMRERGLVCLARDPADDAVIVEVWL